MKLFDLFKGVDIVRSNIDMNNDVEDIKYFSPNVQKGDVFVAVKGSKADGHKYIQNAFDNGAVCVVCEVVPENANIPFILVGNSRQVLAEISKNYFGKPDEELTLVGVTGTNGKTSTTYLLREILKSKFGDVVGLMGTNQNLVGSKPYVSLNTTPQSYDAFKLLREMLDNGCKYVVMEVSSHALRQERVYGITFDIGIFTNLTHDHLDYHGDMEEYKNAKKKLFEMSKCGVINGDDPVHKEMMAANLTNTIVYSIKSDSADLVAKNMVFKQYKTEFEALMDKSINRISVNIPGLFTVYNALAATGAATLMGISLSDIALALRGAKGVLGRYEYVEIDKPYSVIIDYAHTPEGMESVLEMTKNTVKGKLITVFGCGGDRDKTKRGEMGAIAAKYSDKVIITSDNSRSEKTLDIISDIYSGAKVLDSDVLTIPDRKEAILHAMAMAGQDDIIMLLGKGHENYMEKNGERHSFNERDIVKEGAK